MVSRSSASSLDMDQWIRASCAVGLRNIPNVPRTKLANPLYSLRSLAVARVLIARARPLNYESRGDDAERGL